MTSLRRTDRQGRARRQAATATRHRVAARTLHLDLPVSFGDDIDTLFADALARVGTVRSGKQSGDAEAAELRTIIVFREAWP